MVQFHLKFHVNGQIEWGALFEAKNRRHTNLNNPYTFYYIKQGKFSIRKKVLSKVFEDKSPDSYHARRSPVSRE